MKNTDILLTKQDMDEWVEKQIALYEALEDTPESEQEDRTNEDVNFIIHH